jgi:hypothetical protein
MDGFDWLDVMADDIDVAQCLLKRYRVVNMFSSLPDAQVIAGRAGIGRALQMGHYSQYIQTPGINDPVTGSEYAYIGYALKPSTLSNGEPSVRLYRLGSEVGRLEFYTGGNAQYFPNGAVFDSGIDSTGWVYVEIGVLAKNTGGWVQVRVNGRQVYEKTNFDATYTSDGWSNVTIYGHGTSNVSAFDDIYICNGAGTENNTFLGDIRILSLNPNGDNLVEWTPSAAGDHYTKVDDQPLNDGGSGEPWDDTDYIESDTTGNQDLFEYENLPDTFLYQDVVGLQLATVVRTTNEQVLDFKTLVVSGATETALTSGNLMWSNYHPIVAINELDPDTGLAWTPTGIKSAKFGVEVG